MGVPKFFRYISERYPCLSEFVKEYQIPAFDNLYLDMNGIIHMCSHPDDNNPHFRITEERIFADIFHYIEVLFRMIKPQKVFFMAVDGVAPRAKMNQQRGRRFRSAKEAEKLEKEALKKGETLPEVDRFDSNCITPGTEFMARLHEQLKYFVVNKVSTDKIWKKCKVILSGHETPGEGEHKIMDYIRYIRSQPGYDPNTRHCLYGLDADLIMLGLCTHDPHFSLLREEVKFGKKSKRSNVPEEIRFYLLHLSLMREYLELEFKDLKDLEKPKFDIEKIIDDWILMGFLVGNDFIPNLPNLHIANGALPILYKVYIEVLPTLDGYINESGTLNLERFEKFMKKLAELDFKNFEETQEDMMYFETKTGRKQKYHVPVNSKCFEDNTPSTDEPDQKMDPALAALIQSTDDLDISSEDESEETSSSNEDEAFKNFKDEYYMNKLEYKKVTPEVMREQAEGYVRAIQWNLNYYYNGVCSWSWYYPHHYSPYISDIKGFSNLKIDFELGKPFKPYEQLLAVLPTASKNLLPKCYHQLMTDDNSIIKGYYPEEFQTDLNGKRQEWEAVVLVPFIDEKKLLEAMEPYNKLLTPEEVKRNQHGPMLMYEYTEEDLGVYKSPNYFPSVRSQALCTEISIEDIQVPKEKLIKGAYPGAKFDIFYPGFPTLKHLQYKSELRKAKVKVFEMPSRNENMIIEILPNDLYMPDLIPVDLLGSIVWVGWPHLIEAKIVGISNKQQRIDFCPNESNKFKVAEQNSFISELEGIEQYYSDRMGIKFGKTDFLVHVQLMIGRKYVFTSGRRINLEKQFSSIIVHYPLQSVVFDISVHDECHSAFTEISDAFPVGSLCFSLTHPHYGSQGVIMESENCSNNQLKVSLRIVDEPNFTPAYQMNETLKNSYLSLTNSACQLSLSNYLFSRITGSLFVSTRNLEGTLKSVNIGLDLKFNKKNQETPGYTKKIDNVWYYTRKAMDLVEQYVEKFPEVFNYLSQGGDDELTADAIFPDDGDEKVKSIQTWLKTLPTHNIERRMCGSSVLEPEVIKEIENIVDQMPESTKDFIMFIKPHLLFRPDIQFGNLCPDPFTTTKVFDRIVNVREGFTVPLGLKGTVIAIHKSSSNLKTEDDMYDIVFDKPFTGGMALNCSQHRGYRLPKTSFINLSHGKRHMERKTGVPGALRALAKEKNNYNYNMKSENNENFNSRQQNSAFASFNKVPFNSGTPGYNRNAQYNAVQHQSRPYQYVNPHDQYKMKNSFHYLSDFTRVQEVKINKENSSSRRNMNIVPSNQHTIKGPSTSFQKPPNSKPKTEVDTALLKQILNIQTSSNNLVNSRTNLPQQDSGRNQSNLTVKRDQNPKTNTSASARLLSYYQSNLLGCPRYTYLQEEGGFSAQVALPNGQIISGNVARSREEASENVAGDALNILIQKSKSPKQGLPSRFPEPPTKWVQERQNKPSQMFAESHQRLKIHQRTALNFDGNRRETLPNSTKSYNRIQHNNSKGNSSMNSSAHNFVPLQALKKKQVGKVTPSVNRTLNDAQSMKKDKDEILKQSPQTGDLSKGCGVDTVKKRDKGNRHRKPRIAANFNV